MFGFARKPAHVEVGPDALQAMLRDGAAMIVDVREPDEFAAGHIPGAHNLPLSRFDPAQLPDPGGNRLILSCAGGKRSATVGALRSTLRRPSHSRIPRPARCASTLRAVVREIASCSQSSASVPSSLPGSSPENRSIAWLVAALKVWFCRDILRAFPGGRYFNLS